MAAIDTVVVKDAFTSPPGAATRTVALPLRLVCDTPVETLADDLRTRFGEQPLDCVVLAQPVSLREDWRENNVDHESRLLSAWDSMSRLIERGVTRSLGVMDAGEAVIDLLLEREARPVLNQIEFHPYLNGTSLVRHCRDHGVAVQALRCLGPLDVPAHEVLRIPAVTELAQAHGRTPAEIVLKWCLSRVDGVVLDDPERALVISPDTVSDFELSPDALEALDGLHCGYRIDRSPSTLASIHGYLAADPIQVRRVEKERLEIGCHKVLYAPVTRSESFNRRFSFLVWRGFFNLPATMKHALRRRRLSALAERILADLDRDGYALSSVSELAEEYGFRRLAARVSSLAGDSPRKRQSYGEDAIGEEIPVPADLRAAIDAYFGLETVVDALAVVSTPGRLGVAVRQALWHSDVEDLLTVKAYTFLTDVDGFSGPLEYIAESHPKGRFAVPVAELWKHSFVKDPTPAATFQATDELLFRHVRPDLLRRLEGPAGTVVIFDARGLHRGGHVLQGVRQVAISSHVAPNQAHPWREPRSRWSALLTRLRWQSNVKLREPDAGRSA